MSTCFAVGDVPGAFLSQTAEIAADALGKKLVDEVGVRAGEVIFGLSGCDGRVRCCMPEDCLYLSRGSRRIVLMFMMNHLTVLHAMADLVPPAVEITQLA